MAHVCIVYMNWIPITLHETLPLPTNRSTNQVLLVEANCNFVFTYQLRVIYSKIKIMKHNVIIFTDTNKMECWKCNQDYTNFKIQTKA